MTYVFVNTMERRVDDQVEQAQVTINEDDDKRWTVIWTLNGVTEVWYEGLDWNDMLAAFRSRLIEKMKEGFEPILNPKAVRQ